MSGPKEIPGREVRVHTGDILKARPTSRVVKRPIRFKPPSRTPSIPPGLMQQLSTIDQFPIDVRLNRRFDIAQLGNHRLNIQLPHTFVGAHTHSAA